MNTTLTNSAIEASWSTGPYSILSKRLHRSFLHQQTEHYLNCIKAANLGKSCQGLTHDEVMYNDYYAIKAVFQSTEQYSDHAKFPKENLQS